MLDHEDYLRQKRFGSLDGLRALSIIAVIWHHTLPVWAWDIRFAQIGDQGVTLFFAISGFLITSLLLREYDRTGKIDLKAFYLRRCLRIFPLYYTVLAIYIVAVWLKERHSDVGREFFANLPYFATYTSNLFVELKERVIFYFSWSLAVEEQFYLLWPPLLALLIATRRAVLPLLLVLAACIFAQLAGSSSLDQVSVAIVSGALMAIVLHSPSGFRATAKVLRLPGMPLVILVVLAVTLTSGRCPPFVNEMLFAALVGSCVITERHILAVLLQSRPLAYIGTISYGMYLFHMLCKGAVVPGLAKLGLRTDGLGAFFMTLTMVVVAASFSFRYYESVFLTFKKAYAR